MSLDEAKHWLGHRFVFHPAYEPQPHHSVYALVNVGLTHMRVRHRLRKECDLSPTSVHRVRDGGLSHGESIDPRGPSRQRLPMGVEGPSFVGAVEQVRQRLRMVHGRMA